MNAFNVHSLHCHYFPEASLCIIWITAKINPRRWQDLPVISWVIPCMHVRVCWGELHLTAVEGVPPGTWLHSICNFRNILWNLQVEVFTSNPTVMWLFVLLLLCFLNDLVFIRLLVVSAQTSFVSGRSIVCYPFYSLGFSRYPISCIYVWGWNGPDICFSFNWNAIVILLLYLCFHTSTGYAKSTSKNKKKTGKQYRKLTLFREYTDEIRECWIKVSQLWFILAIAVFSLFSSRNAEAIGKTSAVGTQMLELRASTHRGSGD